MQERFRGQEGEQRLIDIIARQGLVHGDRELAAAIAQKGEVGEFDAGDLLIGKDAADTDIYFLLSGRVGIEINNVEVATRQAGTHVGEMAAIDPAALRSANVRALEPTLAIKVTDDVFAELAKSRPDLWRRLAIELADRLRQRTRFFRTPNDRPHLFIGSSAEMLPIAQGIQTGLSHEDMAVTVWTDGVFRASRDAITNLLAVAERADFAVLVLGPDDVVVSRGTEQAAARDNVVFEIGLFIGAAGRDRTFLVKPRRVRLRLPSDLLGLEPLQFDADDGKPLAGRLGPICTQLRDYIATQGVR